jgi:hypothetical protein
MHGNDMQAWHQLPFKYESVWEGKAGVGFPTDGFAVQRMNVWVNSFFFYPLDGEAIRWMINFPMVNGLLRG